LREQVLSFLGDDASDQSRLQVTVFMPTPKSVYLNITVDNVAHLFPSDAKPSVRSRKKPAFVRLTHCLVRRSEQLPRLDSASLWDPRVNPSM
jgi:hypothetical protein